jgi:hypothetical protein
VSSLFSQQAMASARQRSSCGRSTWPMMSLIPPDQRCRSAHQARQARCHHSQSLLGQGHVANAGPGDRVIVTFLCKDGDLHHGNVATSMRFG